MEIRPLIPSIGNPAEGDDRFMPRPAITARINRKLENGAHLLISAPRRIGKTSLLKELLNNPSENQIVKYMIVQSVSSQTEFFKQLFNELIFDDQIYNSLQQWMKQSAHSVKSYISRIKSIKIDGLQLRDQETIDYYIVIQQVFDELAKNNRRIVILIDEFPDALTNIYADEAREGIQFLQRHRELREKYAAHNIQFVYTGSTGLKNVVKKFGEIHLLNNLQEIRIPPLSEDEARYLIKCLVLGLQQKHCADFDIPDSVITHFLNTITWYLPYYIQIIVDKLFDHFEESNAEITNAKVDAVLAEIVRSGSEHADYFEHWKSRLARAFKNEEYKLAVAALNSIARTGVLSHSGYNDMAEQYDVRDKAYVRDVLLYDGYLVTDATQKSLGFNSILLKEWWLLNVAG